MMICPQCGQQTNETIQFCEKCGTDMWNLAKPKTNPQERNQNQPLVKNFGGTDILENSINISTNSIALIIRFIGWAILVVGSITFLIMAMATESPIFLLGILASAISSIPCFGFAEIIHLLQKNTDQNIAMLDWMEQHEKINDDK